MKNEKYYNQLHHMVEDDASRLRTRLAKKTGSTLIDLDENEEVKDELNEAYSALVMAILKSIK